MKTFLRFGLGVCLWIVGFLGVVLTLGGAPATEFLIVDGGWVLLYFLYRYIGNHWDDMRDTGRSLITLGCFAILTGVGALALFTGVVLYMFYVVVGIAFLVFFFAGGGSVADLLGYGPRDREAERDANLRGISNALDDIKKKL
jgi:hypothetical protein